MKPDLSASDFAGLERHNAWFAELNSPIGDHEEGDIFVGIKWAIVGMIIIVCGLAGFLTILGLWG